jgi:SSS family solute:Na+ symporter
MSSLIIVCISAYILVSLGLGLYARNHSQNTAEDYYLAGRSLSWVHLGLTFFASWFSTFAFLGSPGFFYQKGISWWMTLACFNLSAPFLAWFLGRRMWQLGTQYGYITPGDLLAHRYQSEWLRRISAFIGIAALIPYCLIQLVGIGKVIYSSTGGSVSYTEGVLIAVLATGAYTFFGGLRAIVLTDMIQGFIFLFVIILAATAVVFAVGGLQEGFTQAVALKPSAFEVTGDTVGGPLTLTLIWSFGFILLPHMWQRNYMAKSPEVFGKSLLVLSLMSLILILASAFIGLLAIPLVPALADSDQLVPTIYNTLVPPALPILVLATFAAGMSTIDSQLLTASSIIVRDILQSVTHEKLNPKFEKTTGRIAVVITLALLCYLALSPESQGNIVVLASKGISIAFLLLLPLLGALFIKHPSSKAAILSIMLGAGTLALLETKVVNFELPYGFGPSVLCLLLQIPVFLLIQLSDKGAKQEDRSTLIPQYQY